MQIRNTRLSDLDSVMEIYSLARAFMRENGNENQWGNTHPPRSLIESDIENKLGYVVEENGEIIGHVVVNTAKGYGGDISVMTGVDADGKVTGVNILSHAETAGLGAKAAEQSFRDRFVGLVSGITVSKDKAGENSIDAITGATITSRAMTEAVNAAIEAAGGANNG